MKKNLVLILTAAIVGTCGFTAFAGGGGGGSKENDDGSEYAMDCYPASNLDVILGTNYAASDNLYYWDCDTREFLGADHWATSYKEVNFENIENHESETEFAKYGWFMADIIAISGWSNLPELKCANIENDIECIVDSFNNCPKLLNVFVPKSVNKIVNSFKNSNCTIYGIPGSYAESYANQNGIPFENGVEVTINNVGISFDQPAFIKNDRTMVPMRKIFEKLGATVNWDEATQIVTAKKGSTTITLQIGSNILVINGENIELDVPAFIHNDRTLVPVRAISESLGATVNWEGVTQTVSILQ